MCDNRGNDTDSEGPIMSEHLWLHFTRMSSSAGVEPPTNWDEFRLAAQATTRRESDGSTSRWGYRVPWGGAGLNLTAGWDAWFTQGSELDARPGGRIRFRWQDWGPDRIDAEDSGTVRTVEPRRCFSFDWHEDLDRPTLVTFELDDDMEGTRRTVRDEGYPDTEEGRALLLDCAAGWGEALTMLKLHLEHGLRY
jgi:uncharacterized protein YndB with AHSA1/START domain